MSEFSACRFLITRFLYAGFYCSSIQGVLKTTTTRMLAEKEMLERISILTSN